MKFTLIAAALATAVAAQYSEELCSAPVTVTVTEYTPLFPSQTPPTSSQHANAHSRTLSTSIHTPSAPASLAVTAPAPYPTGEVATPVVPSGGALTPLPSTVGTVKPSGTGAYSSPVSEFTGAASHAKVGGFVAGVGAVAALFL
ncbi:hypothetical protein E8E13_003542 [Curvularia kusanoi]|uniref:Uncharacterized protein n=1 Tax=Curvularia kusanoi TaxID=90978 RepID=A0A9P4T5R3_CURKU|nr:hypothetical protein E8E13_003542 [Curvularia kusanoi]